MKIFLVKDYKKLSTGSKSTKLMMENHPIPSVSIKKFSQKKKLYKSFMTPTFNLWSLKEEKGFNTLPEKKNSIFDFYQVFNNKILKKFDFFQF